MLLPVRKYSLKVLLLLLIAGVWASTLYAQEQQPYSAKSGAERVQELQKACRSLDSALIAGDTITLDLLLDEQVRFKHSNGWEETKKDLLDHIRTGYLHYTKITQPDSAGITPWTGKKGGYWHDHFVERSLYVTGVIAGSPFEVKLKTREHWIWKNTGWRLADRESIKLD